MRNLFDQGVPVPLGKRLSGHKVDTTFERGWSTLSNGDLLARAESRGYELLITTDQSLHFQQSLADRQLAIIVLLAASWPRIQQRIERILTAIEQIERGQYSEIPM